MIEQTKWKRGNEMENLKVTTVDQFYKKFNEENTKKVSLPSGDVYQIKSVEAREYLEEDGFDLQTIKMVSGDTVEKNQIILSKMTSEQRKKYQQSLDVMIIKSVINPAVSLKRETNKIHIQDIKGTDYYALLTEINKFALGQGESITPFRDSENEGEAKST